MENKTAEERAVVPVGDLFWDPVTFEHGQRVAQALITSQMVPERFRNVGDVLICLNLSRRMEQVTGDYIDPLMMMQNIYIIKGKPAFETRLAIGFFDALGRWEKINWQVKWQSTDAWTTIDKDTPGGYQIVRAFSKNLKDDKDYYGEEVSVEMARSAGWWGKSGSLWPVMTGMMLRYRSAMFFIRQFEPGVLLGLYTREEVHDMIEAEPGVYELPAEETVTGELLKEVEAPEPVEVTSEVEEKPEEEKTTEPLKFPCEVEGCTAKPFDTPRGLRKHQTQQQHGEWWEQKQRGEEPPMPEGPPEPEPEEPAAVEPEPETTEPEGEEPGEGEDFFTGAAARLEQLRLGCIDADKEAKFYELLATYDCSNIKDVIDLRNQQFTMEMVNAIENILAE